MTSTDVATGCAYCLWRFADTPQDPTVLCEHCKTPYHVECFEENGGCVTFGCPAWTAAQRGEPLPQQTTATPLVPDGVGPETDDDGTWFCMHCGHGVNRGDAFCDQCGNDLGVSG